MKPIYLFSISSDENAISVNSLDIHFFKPPINFNQYDYFILTSKQASEALKQYDRSDYRDKKALCVSVQSALAYEKIGGSILETGGGYGDDLVKNISSYPKATKWLYLRAKVVASDFVSTCKRDGYNIDERVVYESVCSQDIKEIKLQSESILIFTSPSSVKCFLQTHTISNNSKVIVIGQTTALALPENIKYIVSEERTIKSCIKIAKNL